MASLFKRGNVWWGKITINSIQFRDSMGTSDKEVAEKKFEDWVAYKRHRHIGNEERVTFSELADSFIKRQLPLQREKGAMRYLVSIKNLIPYFADLYLDEITSSKLAQFDYDRRLTGVSPSTVLRDLRCMGAMFTHAIVELEVLDQNPINLYVRRQQRRKRLREPQPRSRFLSTLEEEQLLDAATGDLGDLIAFAIDTGLRLEEQLSLTWNQIRHDYEELEVVGKGQKVRRIPILPRSKNILEQLPIRYRRKGEKNWVFCKKNGSRYGKRTRGLAGAVKRANIPHLQWHDLRRTCGCRLLQERGLSMDLVAKWLGLSSIKTTESTYAFVNIGQLHDAVGTKWAQKTESSELSENIVRLSS